MLLHFNFSNMPKPKTKTFKWEDYPSGILIHDSNEIYKPNKKMIPAPPKYITIPCDPQGGEGYMIRPDISSFHERFLKTLKNG